MTEHEFPEIEHLYRIEKFLETMSDLDSLLEAIIRECASALDAASSSLALYDAETDELYFYVVGGEDEERDFEQRLKSFRMKMGAGIMGWCAGHRETVIIDDAYTDPRFNREADRKTGFRTRSIIAVPMIRGEKLIGVVEAVNKNGDGVFTGHDAKVLSVLAAQSALIIENARLQQENLRQARLTAMGQGIAGAAHCIKNILSSIGGGEFILETGLKRQDFEKVEKGWDVMKRNTHIMKDLVLDMLTYSRDREPEKATTDLNRICSDIADLMSGKAGEREVKLSLDPGSGLEEIVIDPKGIYRCILNLVSNAIDACETSRGKVTISTVRNNDRRTAAVSVADNGCGIDKEDQEKLFTVFFSTKGSKGTGLGLAVTKKIIEEHGGTIGVMSETGKGTTFTITLPI